MNGTAEAMVYEVRCTIVSNGANPARPAWSIRARLAALAMLDSVPAGARSVSRCVIGQPKSLAYSSVRMRYGFTLHQVSTLPRASKSTQLDLPAAAASASSIESISSARLVIRIVPAHNCRRPCRLLPLAFRLRLLFPVACAHWAAAPLGFPPPAMRSDVDARLARDSCAWQSGAPAAVHACPAPPAHRPHRLSARPERHQIPALPALIDQHGPGVRCRRPVATRLAVRSHLSSGEIARASTL